MGYDLARFQGDVDEELICPICSGVLEEPVQAVPCEHAFCEGCIKEWLTRKAQCPVDRQPLQSNQSQLKPAPRILRNLLARLSIECDYKYDGCTTVVKLDLLRDHATNCDFNPKKQVPCPEGCGVVVPRDEKEFHHCVRALRETVTEQAGQIEMLKTQMDQMKREQTALKSCLRAIRATCPQLEPMLPNLDEIEQDEVQRWTSTLLRARVTRWGGMISTPDSALQETVRKSLIDSGCPLHIVNDLMENSHERRWPPGLSTLEIRQMNRRFYDNYVCRRIPGRQAVVVMSCENHHMSEDMILEPGLVMIFAHGIE